MDQMRLPLSVIVVTHNQVDILAHQIRSLESQIGIDSSEFELIVTDDSSRPTEVEKMKMLLKSSQLTSRLLHQESDRFWATRARNAAVGVASGELLLFFDGDMIPESDVLAQHVQLHSGREKQIVAGHRLRRRVRDSGDRLIEDCRRGALTDATIARWQQDEEKKRSEFLGSKHPWRVVFSCHMSVRSAAEVYFDERFVGWGPEDWELAYRLTQRHGYVATFASNVIAYEVDQLGHGVGNVFRTRTQQSIIDYLRNTFYFFDSCPGLEIELVFWGLRKLDLEGDHWVVTPTNADCDIVERFTAAKAWLIKHNHYEDCSSK
jgi:glycosyltransferase involved in cell wall biosynthesis